MGDEVLPESPASTQPWTHVQLATWARVLTATVGGAGLTAGGLAVFVTDNEAGTLALLIVGLVLILVGTTGVLPKSLKFGDKQIEWVMVQQERESARDLKDALEGSTPEKASEVAQNIVERRSAYPLLTDRPDPISIAAQSYLNELEVLSALKSFSPPESSIHTAFGPARIDGLIELSDGKKIAVEVKNLFGGSYVVRGAVEQLAAGMQSVAAYGGILVLRGRKRVIPSAVDHLARSNNIKIVQWQSDQDGRRLSEALQELLDQPDD